MKERRGEGIRLGGASWFPTLPDLSARPEGFAWEALPALIVNREDCSRSFILPSIPLYSIPGSDIDTGKRNRERSLRRLMMV